MTTDVLIVYGLSPTPASPVCVCDNFWASLRSATSRLGGELEATLALDASCREIGTRALPHRHTKLGSALLGLQMAGGCVLWTLPAENHACLGICVMLRLM